MDTNTPSSLDEVRASIDAIDRSIVALLCERQQFVRQAAQFKKDEHAVRAPDRVEAVITRVRELAANGGGSPDVAEDVYRAMINAFITYELAQHQQATNDAQ